MSYPIYREWSARYTLPALLCPLSSISLTYITGVHSPTLSGTTQLDCYRPLFLPTILIGDSKLGGISSTISSYESLLLRGYIVDGVLLFRDEYYRNWEYLNSYFAERGIHVQAFDPPPPRQSDPQLDFKMTEEYYQRIVPSSGEGTIFETIAHLDARHSGRISELDTMPRRTLETIWWPFVQHGLMKEEQDVNIIDSAWGDFFTIYNDHRRTPSTTVSKASSILEPQFDGSASWWTQTLGHSHPALSLAAARAAGRYGHVMFPQASHLPALKLAERLVHNGPGKWWASRAFFSDDGSTGMEVALKMALRAFTKRNKDMLLSHQNHKLGVLGLKGSYHGDTIGAMDACETGVYTCEWHESKGYWLDPPTLSIQDGVVTISLPPMIKKMTSKTSTTIPMPPTALTMPSLASAYNVEERLETPLAEVYRDYIKSTLRKLLETDGPRLAALVLEPIVMGAGGMIFVDPLFQRVLVDVVRGSQAFGPPRPGSQWSGLPVIFDEVFVGLYRLGLESCSPLLGVYPDILVNAKMLTGGLMPLAVTMASDSIFQAFVGEEKTEALLHGHSYTAYPAACEVANETLDIMEKLSESEHWTSAREKWGVSNAGTPAVWSFWDPNFVDVLSKLDSVTEVMAFGTVLAIKVQDDAGGKWYFAIFYTWLTPANRI